MTDLPQSFGLARPYSFGKYGRNSYDHQRLSDIWIPVPDTIIIPPPIDFPVSIQEQRV